MEKIKIENLTFTYPDKKTPALDNINIEIADGEFVTVCGKSGCGKSTLLRQLKPILAPNGDKNGAVYLNGCDMAMLTQKEQAENIGFVMQNPDNQIVCDKVWHELAFGLECMSYKNTEIRGKVAEMAAFFGIEDWYYKDVCELSGGQKQLLNLASVMVMNPSVLILDEPTSQLDPIHAHNFLDTVAKINKELGTTIVLSEHRLEEALPLTDRVIVMDAGRIIADGDVNSVGEILKNMNNDMLLALPTPMRVYYSINNDKNSPVTVREGRAWLSKVNINDIKLEDKKCPKTEAAIKIEDAWFRYEKNAPDILKGLSLSINSGEFYAIVGGNGAGKTTFLSSVMGVNKIYRGRMEVSKKTAALPQNPTSLFVNKTVIEDLKEMTENEDKLMQVIRFCELENLIRCHPYDLSGGEQQRMALAKVLLCEPDILLLDEPTKGLDVHFKIKLAKMIKNLQKNGVTVVMVSHDVEFCAKYADRVAMFFDGHIVSEDSPRAFFSGKSFYTTAANKMARNILPGAVLDEDIISAIGGTQYENSDDIQDIELPKQITEAVKTEPDKVKKITWFNIIAGIIFAVLFCVTEYFFDKNDYSMKSYVLQLLSIIFLGISLYNFIPKRKSADMKVRTPKKRTVLTALAVLLLIPLTIFIGIFYLGDRKYYFISILIILEILLPFFFIFESRKAGPRELVLISVLCAVTVAGRVAFAALPQFKPVLALVIISGICFGNETGFLVGAMTAFISNFYFTHGPWTPWQMFAYGIVGFLAGILFQNGLLHKNKITTCIFGFLATVIVCGGILNIGNVIMSQGQVTLDMIKSSIVLGFPLDVIHGASTVLFLWFIFEPMCEKIERIKTKYGLTE